VVSGARGEEPAAADAAEGEPSSSTATAAKAAAAGGRPADVKARKKDKRGKVGLYNLNAVDP
jgi:hypothetical protein